MRLNSKLLRALNSSHAHARPILASALRGPSHAAMLHLSAVAANPIICSPRLFSSFTPASSPTTTMKPTTEVDPVYKQATKKTRGSIKKTEEPTEYSEASPEHISASSDFERKQKKMLRNQKDREAKIKKRQAELKAIPKPPKGVTNGYNLFTQQLYQSPEFAGKKGFAEALAMWKALSETERQRFTKDASDSNQLRAAEYDKWAQEVGYTSIRKLNRDRVRSGKEKLRIPANLRPVRKTPIFTTFFRAKLASGEVSTLEGVGAASKRAGELWRQLTPSQKAVYEADMEAEYLQKLAARSRT
ncbi:hypothetical protein BKA62DRAFT_757741 [Auriculariales sp. MPI-PUGE-AT-0066]|nr:hypothetical protein BKA62DRAFT_757741 [Auriculariales sp. MPI-PUGE-AT-0066]